MLQFLVQSEEELRKRQALPRVGLCVHRGGEEGWRKEPLGHFCSPGEKKRCKPRSIDPLTFLRTLVYLQTIVQHSDVVFQFAELVQI